MTEIDAYYVDVWDITPATGICQPVFLKITNYGTKLYIALLKIVYGTDWLGKKMFGSCNNGVLL